MPIFPTLFSPPPANPKDRPLFSCPDPRRVYEDSTYNIYPIAFLNRLIEKIKKTKGDEETSHVVRFLVDSENQLWIAEEGCANQYTPAHYQLTGEPATSARCITAGNIRFSEDYKEIICINHKSGDFRPSFDSLKWALAILVANEAALAAIDVKLADTITIEQLSSSGGGMDEPIYDLDKTELTTEIQGLFAVDLLSAQPSVMRETSYMSERKRRRFDHKDPAAAQLQDATDTINRSIFFGHVADAAPIADDSDARPSTAGFFAGRPKSPPIRKHTNALSGGRLLLEDPLPADIAAEGSYAPTRPR